MHKEEGGEAIEKEFFRQNKKFNLIGCHRPQAVY